MKVVAVLATADPTLAVPETDVPIVAEPTAPVPVLVPLTLDATPLARAEPAAAVAATDAAGAVVDVAVLVEPPHAVKASRKVRTTGRIICRCQGDCAEKPRPIDHSFASRAPPTHHRVDEWLT